MKTFLLIIFLISLGSQVAAQGIFAADINIGRSSYGVSTYINTYTEGPGPTFLLLDYGDGQEDVLLGQNFDHGGGVNYNMYYPNSSYGLHIYEDTGTYTIMLKDAFWAGGITNMENSEDQPFLLSADVNVISDEPGFVYNISVLFSTTADYIKYETNGSISHPPVPVDPEVDSIAQRLVDIDATGYYLPAATDSLVCCFTWDRPTEPGKYAFGFDFEDYRWGKKMGRVQRYITVEVDTVFSSNNGLNDQNSRMVVFPNPTNDFLRVFFKGAFVLGFDYSISIKNALGVEVFQKPIGLIEYGSGISINVGTWPPGLYLLSLEAGGQVWTEQVVVK